MRRAAARGEFSGLSARCRRRCAGDARRWRTLVYRVLLLRVNAMTRLSSVIRTGGQTPPSRIRLGQCDPTTGAVGRVRSIGTAPTYARRRSGHQYTDLHPASGGAPASAIRADIVPAAEARSAARICGARNRAVCLYRCEAKYCRSRLDPARGGVRASFCDRKSRNHCALAGSLRGVRGRRARRPPQTNIRLSCIRNIRASPEIRHT